MSIDKVINKIEKGKQIGKIFSFKSGDETIWSSVAIQKINDFYRVYIDEISESKMNIEEYNKEYLKSFTNIKDAISFLNKNSQIELIDLQTLKGQKIFNPLFKDTE